MNTSNTSIRRYDIAVVGAGAVGLATAAALKQAAPKSTRVAVIDPRPRAQDGHLRTVALSEGSRHLLERVGAWGPLEAKAQPILAMAIYDGGLRDPARLEQLQFSAREGEAPLAHMAFNDDVVAALSGAAESLGVDFFPASVDGFEAGATIARLKLSDGGTLDARLIVAADGARSKLRTFAKLQTVGWDTGQSGIVATIAHEYDHAGRAEQHFLPAGPFAILPLRGKFSSIVWNESHADAEAMLARDEDDLLSQLELRFTLKLGDICFASKARAFPLRFQFARSFVAPRLALVGDAAHLVHPLAGQGLNLGLRDVAALAERVIEPLRLGLDPADPEALAGYQRDRRFDVTSSGFGMDAMNRLFSNEIAPVKVLRDFGLRLVDRSERVKRALIAEAAGAGERAPRLLRGLGL
jgi:2-octaprenyl-6-methoxyphenol hydroxylase